jgi:phage gp36-like protein
MSYLSNSDFQKSIKDHRLQQIIDSDLEEEVALLAYASDTAESIIRDYLNSRYDVDAIFAKSGNQRDKQVTRWMLMIAIYVIYDRIEDDMVPERVIKNYDDTLKHLVSICDGRVEAVLPRKKDDEDNPKTKFRWGSNRMNSRDFGTWPNNPEYRDN